MTFPRLNKRSDLVSPLTEQASEASVAKWSAAERENVVSGAIKRANEWTSVYDWKHVHIPLQPNDPSGSRNIKGW